LEVDLVGTTDHLYEVGRMAKRREGRRQTLVILTMKMRAVTQITWNILQTGMLEVKPLAMIARRP